MAGKSRSIQLIGAALYVAALLVCIVAASTTQLADTLDVALLLAPLVFFTGGVVAIIQKRILRGVLLLAFPVLVFGAYRLFLVPRLYLMLYRADWEATVQALQKEGIHEAEAQHRYLYSHLPNPLCSGALPEVLKGELDLPVVAIPYQKTEFGFRGYLYCPNGDCAQQLQQVEFNTFQLVLQGEPLAEGWQLVKLTYNTPLSE